MIAMAKIGTAHRKGERKMKNYIKIAVALAGAVAIAFGIAVAIGAVEAWNFTNIPAAILSCTLGVGGLMVGDAWEW